MGYHDERRFPDFSFISRAKNFTQMLDCVIISHFHLDHCGALPYFSEMCGYNGPIIMTHPTKAICPILLEDYRKITVNRQGETNFFTSDMIKECMKKVVTVQLLQTYHVDQDLEVTAYYAGHVLGAAMFHVKVGNESVVYTGDYNMTPDRHLGSAWIDKLRTDVLITETTYATTIRDSKRCRERDFLKQVHECVKNGGKVLIPVFALGRAQELCILLETFWNRMNLTVPIYFSTGLTEKANYYYKLFISWTNQNIKQTFVKRNMFDFKHVQPFDRAYVHAPGPMVLFATPGMLHAGTSLDVFKEWAPNPKNMVIIVGYCVAGTVGNKLLNGAKRVEIDKKTTVEVNCKIKNLSFSAHADAKGILQLIRQLEPRNIVLVHGEKGRMQYFKDKVQRDFGIPCYDPPNGTTVYVDGTQTIPVDISRTLLKRKLPLADRISASLHSEDTTVTSDQPTEATAPVKMETDEIDPQENKSIERLKRPRPPAHSALMEGILLMKSDQSLTLLDRDELLPQLNTPEHIISFSSKRSLATVKQSAEELLTTIATIIQRDLDATCTYKESIVTVNNKAVQVRIEGKELKCEWTYQHEDLAVRTVKIIDSLIESSTR
eukprot:GILJ01009780.1.p1 GENE.GILJ01009780.1~~GILJ01009780.1.p1  ORF type:complete len:648 (+),score=86.46 GILJ01009780.1:130-1944(+)